MTAEPMDSDSDKYALQKILLRFKKDETEQAYRASIGASTLRFLRAGWIAMLLFGVAFSVLDVPFFKEHASTIITARIAMLVVIAAMLGLSFVRRFHRHLVYSPAAVILSVGSFCILQIALSPPDTYSPYAMGVLLAFCGTFCTVGMGFSYSVFALVGTLLIFELFLGILFPASPGIFLVYNFFYICFVCIFGFLGYYTEAVSRKQFATSERLKTSLDNVAILQDLLPICACCKQIRDDKGYWSQIETYLSKHADIQFTHGICPDCAKIMYPDI